MVEEGVAVEMEGLETVEVSRRHIMAEEEVGVAVDLDVVTMVDQLVAGLGMVGRITTSRDMVVEVEVAIVDGMRTAATTNKSEATMEVGNGLHRGNRVRPTMEIGQCTIISNFFLFAQEQTKWECMCCIGIPISPPVS